MQKQVQYIIKGMNRDMTVSKFPADHSFENRNIRITQSEGQTLLSVTNEKGPNEIPLFWDRSILYTNMPSGHNIDVNAECVLGGKILGHCAIRQYLVLFVREDAHTASSDNKYWYYDSIYRIVPETGSTVCLVRTLSFEYITEHKEIFEKDLSFGDSVVALGLYENDSIIKVYFADARNQNRVINIVDPTRLKYEYVVVGSDSNDDPIYDWRYVNTFSANDLNFIPLQDFGERIKVNRIDSSNGVFAPGTIQYALSYSNLYGQETSIFYQSDLYYTSFSDRGGNEEETVSNAFKIELKDLDTSFDYVRIYSILRTSLNATPQCNLVAQLKVEDRDITFIDNGTLGQSYDYNALLYMNGEIFSSKTLAEKDSTLFCGNLNILIPRLPKDLKEYLRDSVVTASPAKSSTTDSIIDLGFVAEKPYSLGDTNGSYPYNIHLDKSQKEITTFKYGETYRFGLQFLHKSGKWSDVVFLADAENTVRPITQADNEAVDLVNAKAELHLNSGFDTYSRWLNDNGFIKMRPVVVYPELWDRTVLAQGIVCPTVYNVEDRKSNRPFAYSSWYARPNSGSNALTNTLGSPKGAYNEFRHNQQIPNNKSINAEIQCITETGQSPYNNSSEYSNEETVTKWVQKHRENFFIDKSIVTLHSPELELSTDLDVIDLTNVKFRIVGIAPLTGFDSNIYISTSTVGNHTHNEVFLTDSDNSVGTSMIGPGFYDEQTKVDNISTDGWRSRMGNINWIDEETHYKEKHADDGHVYKKAPKWYGFFIYPWHRSKSLNNTVSPDENGWESALLQNKIITNSRYSFNSLYFSKAWEPVNEISGVKLANIEPQSEESEVSLIKIPAPENSDLDDLNYYGSVDKIVMISNDKNKSVGYPIIIAGSSRLTAKDGSNPTTTNWEGSSTAGPRAMTNHELFTGDYDHECFYYGSLQTLTNHPIGSLFEYLPYGFTSSNHPGSTPSGVDHDDNVWSNYVTATDGDARRAYWQVSTFDPIRIRYKSTKHAVMAFNYNSDHQQVILPRLSSDTATSEFVPDFSSSKYFWEIGKANYATGTWQDTISQGEYGIGSSAYGYLFIGELYRDIDSSTRFGGVTEEALEQNTWIPAGKVVNIDETEITIDRGDTFYQRYDCLKTYPFTPDEKNSMIETVSFMCETRINCDGRYDKNRGNATKFTITPKNFNLMNSAYNQKNNFFNYKSLNSNRVYPDHFNQVTWSMTKSLGEEIDTWAKINLGSLLGMDGEYGEIVALVFFGNEIWCFQEKGISKILFNTRVQIPVSDGVPIEITNGMKVQGKVYITTKAGLQNKFAITATPNGVYFMDGYNNTISLFNGQSIQNISDIKGFREWMYGVDAVTEWKGRYYTDAFKVFYDSVAQDVYFVNGTQCLVFSELLAEFVSFFDYENTPVMDTVKGSFKAVTNFTELFGGDPRIRLWNMFGGDYNVFYKPEEEEDWESYYRPFYVQYNVNPDPTLDKTFDNVEFRSDSWERNNLVTALESAGSNKTFDTLEVENEYQYGSLALDFSHAKYSQDSTLKRKFRVWRTIMPREVGTRNRIRNTWCKVKLAWNNPNRYKTVLHDTVIKYFV